jgi:broad specificity phosphatase PhoE
MIVIIRSGVTTLACEGYIEGTSDSPLSELGEHQIKETINHFYNVTYDKKSQIQLIVANKDSSVASAMTAQKVLYNYGCPSTIKILPSLHGRYWGKIDGQHEDTQGVQTTLFMIANARPDQRINNEETRLEHYDRIHEGLKEYDLVFDEPGITKVFIAHYSTANILRAIYNMASEAEWKHYVHSAHEYFVYSENKMKEVGCAIQFCR